MQRLKSIDSYRGLMILLMVWVHLTDWWLIASDRWFFDLTYVLVDRIFAPGFLFISGLSATLLVRKRIKDGTDVKIVRSQYFLRSLFILVIAIIFNISVAIGAGDPSLIWTWFILFTLAISLLMIYPLLKLNKIARSIIAIALWIANYYILLLLAPFQGQANFFGVLYHLLFNSLNLEPILSNFSYVIIGSVIGDIIFDIYKIENRDQANAALKKRVLYPLLIMGLILIPLGIFAEFPWSDTYATFSWKALSLGTCFILFSLFVAYEIYGKSKFKRDYRFFYYFSFYSFTTYLGHFLLYFLFLHMLHVIYACFLIPLSMFLIFILLRIIYKSKWRYSFSLKVQLGRLSSGLTERIYKIE